RGHTHSAGFPYTTLFRSEKSECVVLTNDAGILNQLMRRDDVEIVLLGGRLRRKNMAFYGGQTEAALDSLQVDRLFLGVDGLDLQDRKSTRLNSSHDQISY